MPIKQKCSEISTLSTFGIEAFAAPVERLFSINVAGKELKPEQCLIKIVHVLYFFKRSTYVFIKCRCSNNPIFLCVA